MMTLMALRGIWAGSTIVFVSWAFWGKKLGVNRYMAAWERDVPQPNPLREVIRLTKRRRILMRITAGSLPVAFAVGYYSWTSPLVGWASFVVGAACGQLISLWFWNRTKLNYFRRCLQEDRAA
jgi:hypothetical protein